MLRELAVQNLALIEDVRVELHPGFCAWTGETGAGKTLLLEALGLLLGERGSPELLRSGAEELRIVGVFETERAEQKANIREILETSDTDAHLVVTRRLSRTGRSYAYVNEQPVAIGTLKRLGAVLLDVHGQRESQSLLEPGYQLRLLDAFGDLEGPRQSYQELVEQVRFLRRELGELESQRQQRQRDLALVRFEREELDNSELIAGEVAKLARERERLTHAQGLQSFAATSVARLYDDEGSIVERLGKTRNEAESWLSLDAALADVARRLDGLLAEAQDLAETLRSLAEHWEAEPARQEEVEERLRLLRRLEAKYGRSIDDLIAYRTTLDEQEKLLQKQEDDSDSVRKKLAAAFAQMRDAGKELSKQRQRASKRLITAVQRELADLGMAEARLDAQLEAIEVGEDPMNGEVPGHGFEQLELMLAANRGEPARPLRKVASGGELSRAMLALKTVLAAHDQVGTLVFDEIDANVGGRLGDVLGEKLAALGRTHQVICVTHLPQVASYAPHQWTIRKVRHGQRTTTAIELLGEEERIEELASMLRGKSRSENTRKEALAMLNAAKKSW